VGKGELSELEGREETMEKWLTHLELEGRVGGDDGGEAALAVSVVGSAGEDSLLAERELGNALVPSFDHAADTNLFSPGAKRQPKCSRKKIGMKGQLTAVTKGDPRSRDESNLLPLRRVPT
jgi:hypothetical protein